MSKSNDRSNKKTKMIYLDYAASVLANSSSIHSIGIAAKIKLQNSRREVADVLGARPEEIIFTSGGTESNNLAIQGVVFAWHEKNQEKNIEKILPHIITTNIEHPSVLETCKLLEKRKFAQITIVPVETNGIVDPQKIKKEIKKNTILISVMYANNEIGTIQPIKEIAKEIRHYKNNSVKVGPSQNCEGPTFTEFPVFHIDATQAVNYLDLNVERLGVDLLSLSGAKIEEAGRVGALYKKKTVSLANIFGGGDQEMGLRPGTENLPEILKFSTALKTAQNIKEKETKRLAILRDYFFAKVSRVSRIPLGIMPRGILDTRLVINGDLKNRLPNNLNVTFPKIPSDLLVIELSAKGIMASSKSACKSSSAEGSYVIKAIRDMQNLQGKALQDEIGGMRFSLGRDTTKKDIDYTIKVLSKIVNKLEKWYN